MSIDVTIVLYIFFILTQLLFCFFKNKIYGLLPICLVILIFLFTCEEDLYSIAIFQCIIFFINYIIQLVVKSFNKKNNNKIDKMKIKDL